MTTPRYGRSVHDVGSSLSAPPRLMKRRVPCSTKATSEPIIHSFGYSGSLLLPQKGGADPGVRLSKPPRRPYQRPCGRTAVCGCVRRAGGPTSAPPFGVGPPIPPSPPNRDVAAIP